MVELASLLIVLSQFTFTFFSVPSLPTFEMPSRILVSMK